MLKWMYDDDAPTPAQQAAAFAKKIKDAAAKSPTAKSTLSWARGGLYVGAFVGTIIIVGGIAQTFNRIVLGNGNQG